MEFDSAPTPRGIPNLQFNQDRFPHTTLKAFNEFIEQYEFRYEAQYPEPPKHAIEACITKWTATTKREPTYTDMEFIKNTRISKGKIKSFLGFLQQLDLSKIGRLLNQMKFYRGTVHGITFYKNSDHITNQPKIL